MTITEEAAGNWRKSSHSGTGNCVEVGQDSAVVLVRDTQAPDGAVLTFSAAAWTAFCHRLAG